MLLAAAAAAGQIPVQLLGPAPQLLVLKADPEYPEAFLRQVAARQSHAFPLILRQRVKRPANPVVSLVQQRILLRVFPGLCPAALAFLQGKPLAASNIN